MMLHAIMKAVALTVWDKKIFFKDFILYFYVNPRPHNIGQILTPEP